ncbi:MAG: protease modulator HflC [Lentisphaerae bacterium]|nr:protease modulator HflC [Lentisphaerota bacterium]
MSSKIFKHWPTLLLGVFVFAVLLVAVFTYQVNMTEVAVIERMGQMLNEHPEPGLHFRWPYPFEKITKYDKRMHCFGGHEGQIEETATADKQNILVGIYVAYKIQDPLVFAKRMTTFQKAESELDIWMRGAKSAAFGKYKFDEILTTDAKKMRLNQIADQIKKDIAEKANPYGLDICAVGITSLNVPEAVSSKVFERMNQDRMRAAQDYLSKGKLRAEEIRIAADKERANIIAMAEAQAKEISAKGDVEAAQYLRVFAKNPELAAFLRKLDSLRTIMKGKTTVVLDTNTDPFTLLKSNADVLNIPADNTPGAK